MKKIILILFVFFIGVSSSFAYNYSTYVEIDPSQSGQTSNSEHTYAYIGSGCQFHYFSHLEGSDTWGGYNGIIYLKLWTLDHYSQYLSVIGNQYYCANGETFNDDFTMTASSDLNLEINASGNNCYGFAVLEW
jgi:hypothetical protein